MSTLKHRALNKKQLDILRLLYRFRFANTELLTQALDLKSKIKMNERLKVLLDQQYIGRNFEPEYRLLRKHASYFLLPNGIEALKQMQGNKFDASVLRGVRGDHNRSDQFIEECLGIFKIFCQLKAQHGEDLNFFTRSQLVNRYDYFSEFTPSVYIRLVCNGTEKDYFLEYLQISKPSFAHAQRLKAYIEYADSGEWEDATNSDFPRVLLVCDASNLENRLIKRAQAILGEVDEELEISITNKEMATWRNLAAPDETLSLSPI